MKYDSVRYESGDYEGAIAVLKEATWLLRNDALAFNIMGTCYMCLGKYVEAIAAFDKVLSLYEDPAVHFNKVAHSTFAESSSHRRIASTPTTH